MIKWSRRQQYRTLLRQEDKMKQKNNKCTKTYGKLPIKDKKKNLRVWNRIWFKALPLRDGAAYTHRTFDFADNT